MDTAAEAVKPDPLISIEMTNAMQSVKEIYYADGKGSVFTNRNTKRSLIWTLLFLILAGLLYLFSFSDRVALIFLFVVASGAFLISLWFFFFRAKAYFQWKDRVESMLKGLAKVEKQTLTVSDQSFELINGDEVVIERWETVKKTSINPTFIFLASEFQSQYIFPAKSMKPEEFQMLKEFVEAKMKISSPAIPATSQPA
jgi:hypothetical protein